MAPRPYILAETTWKTVREANYEVVVLPCGATEAHNYHLPYATEAVAAAQAWGDAHVGGARTVCLIHPDNQPSLRIAEKFGFREYARTTYKGEPGVLLERPAQL